jgi:hypothetical protein
MGFGKQHKLWFNVFSDAGYVKSLDFGAEEYVEIIVNVGRSKSKSAQPAKITIKRTGEMEVYIQIKK